MRTTIRALAALSICVAWAQTAHAADHREAPLAAADPAADIADLYAWHANGRLVTVITFDGLKPPAPGQRGTFDEGVVYTLHLDNTGDFVPDIQIQTWFVRRGVRRFVVVEGLPGVRRDRVFGPVQRRLRSGSALIFAGLTDDPFFFDLEGFRTTLATGTLSFDRARDTFAGANATAIVLEMDLEAALGGGQTLNVWATTARRQG